MHARIRISGDDRRWKFGHVVSFSDVRNKGYLHLDNSEFTKAMTERSKPNEFMTNMVHVYVKVRSCSLKLLENSVNCFSDLGFMANRIFRQIKMGKRIQVG